MKTLSMIKNMRFRKHTHLKIKRLNQWNDFINPSQMLLRSCSPKALETLQKSATFSKEVPNGYLSVRRHKGVGRPTAQRLLSNGHIFEKNLDPFALIGGPIFVGGPTLDRQLTDSTKNVENEAA